jgi:hypothetical protein
MRTPAIAFLALTAFFTGCVCVEKKSAPVLKAPSDETQKMASAYKSAEIRYSGERVKNPLPILELLRMGQTNAAVEMLEYNLDSAIIKAHASMRSVPHDDNKPAQRALLDAKAYRANHPRMVASSLSPVDIDSLRDLREKTRLEAEAILQRLPDDKGANKSIDIDKQ